MPLLFFLLFPALEIACLIFLAQEFGFFNMALTVATGSLLGLIVLVRIGRSFLLDMQREMQKGSSPQLVMVRQAMLFVAGLLLLLPGVLSDVFAVVFIVLSFFPSLLRPVMEKTWSRVSTNGSVFVYTSTSGFGSPSSRPMRDVSPSEPEVIDLLPDSKDPNP